MTKRFLLCLAAGLLAQMSVWAQGTIYFDLIFAGTAPSHPSFLPAGGGALIGDMFSPIVYLDPTALASGQVLEQQGDSSFLPVSGLNAVIAGYEGGNAVSLEKTFQLTTPQIQNLLDGKWYAEVMIDNTTYLGQFVVVPEPSSLALLGGGAILVFGFFRRKQPYSFAPR